MSDYELARSIADKLTDILHDVPFMVDLQVRRVKPMDVLNKCKDKRELYFFYLKICRNWGA